MEEEKNKIEEEKEEKKADSESTQSTEYEFDEEDHNKSFDEEEKRKRRKRIDLIIEWSLIFILGILVGIAIKTEAKKTLTVGPSDRKMKIFSQDYNINQMQKDLAEKAKATEEQSSAPESDNGTGADQAVPESGTVPETQAPQN